MSTLLNVYQSNTFDATVPCPGGMKLVEQVHTGSVFDVWKIEDRQTGQLYALKCLTSKVADDTDMRCQLRREIDVSIQFQSRFVVRAEDSGQIRLQPFLILEWLNGKTIAQLVNELTYHSIGQTLWMVRQAATGLCDLENAGYSHCNLSSRHLFVTDGGEVKILDFSQAQTVGQFEVNRGICDESPAEFSRTSAHTLSHDMFCLGAIWYELLIGQPVATDFGSLKPCPTGSEITTDQLIQRRPTIPQEVAKLVAQMLDSEPLCRPQSFAELTRRLIGLELQYLPVQYQMESRHDKSTRLEDTGSLSETNQRADGANISPLCKAG